MEEEKPESDVLNESWISIRWEDMRWDKRLEGDMTAVTDYIPKSGEYEDDKDPAMKPSVSREAAELSAIF